MIPQTKMATATEVEGTTTVSVPPEVEAGLAREQATPDEKQTTPTEEAPVQEETQTEATEVEEPQPTRKERRVGDFVEKLKTKDKELSALQEELNRIKGGTTPQNQSPQPGFGLPPWEVPQVQPGQEMSAEQYQQQVVGAANTLTDIKLTKFKQDMARVNDFSEDVRYVEKTYDILNPDNADVYNKSASRKITELYQKASKGDPSLRLKDFVDDFMSFRQEGRNEGMKEITPKVLKQQAEGAIPPSTPSGKRSGEVSPDNMSTAEMEQYLKDNGLWDH